ncbi:MAG: hypothetical protein A2306_01385 [Omnitrophica WOR_2 bacterium RIFOXYB2_FULL_38_16]|nr:MAG: hypothetical protein A2243_06910 [Omnitrophica WOR_2 bacterium RIFOXYA2_FULL_38_17]OGX57406.1 MAG: hypothetical protein A2447_03800 [Omnitrophica WOR_2 bacterium RIFOXYC2_FULL_38_12]OGX59354.1 MAG: hypothetical protein A2306_01385 [Omnitrophica WOR_2 bacterium RIFOXYB2_FULL_38_16]HBG62358.1 7-carboxy-7-deazaguanine synthase QueE [Candidatus Omnitrophota bacterium]
MKAKISEIFRSIQGEGKYLGVSQVFVRFAECNIDCIWCDTDFTVKEQLDEVELIKRIKGLMPGCHSLSLTGGEPLVQIKFIKSFLPMICKEGINIFLETNGTLVKEFKQVLKYLDIVSMDIKLPSSAGCGEHWQEHSDFLKIAVGSKKDVYVKIVVTQGTIRNDIVTAVELISQVSKTVPLIIQPEFIQRDGLMQKCQEYLYLANGQLNDVRIIPQVHKLMGWK